MSRSTERFVWAILGLTGSGKTFLAEKYLGGYPRPVFIIDVMNEWTEYGRPFARPHEMFADAAAWLASGATPAPGGVYRLVADRTHKAERAFELADELQVPGTYICDELHRYAPSGKVTPFLEMIRTGRHASQSVVGITQRPQSVHNHAIEEAAIVSFRVSGRAAEHVEREMPPSVTASDLSSLGARQYRIGGNYAQLRRFLDVGEDDGSVWTYEADAHEVVKVEPA